MVIRLEGVRKSYPGSSRPAVNGVSLSVRQGEVVSLLGPSGCGKTTVLRLIAGLEAPDEGFVEVNGRTVAARGTWIPPESRGVGMVFQDYALFPHMTVGQNVAFGLKGSCESRVRETLDLVGLCECASAYPSELSGGQQQRVALARALAPRPVVVLLDEPFSNLDAGLRAHMRREVGTIIRKSKATAVFVTHDQKEALSISDRVAVMRDGRIEQEGTSRQVYESPETEFVASFVGQTNMLDGIVGSDGDTVVTCLGAIPCSNAGMPGERVRVSVRPNGFAPCADGQVCGTVEEISYLGDTQDLVVRISPSGEGRSLVVTTSPLVQIGLGEQVRLAVLPRLATVIRGEEPKQVPGSNHFRHGAP